MNQQKTPNLLLILDGWGCRDSADANAISLANTPVWDSLLEACPHTLIHTSGLKVGLPEGQMGNSEVGHMNLGAGRIVYQNLTRINKAIEDGNFFTNPALVGACEKANAAKGALHIIGLLSPGGIHSHEQQIAAMIDLAEQQACQHIYLHALLDGRDTPPRSAESSLQYFSKKLADSGRGQIASVSGRYFGMDRDKRWERVEKAYLAIVEGRSDDKYLDALSALMDAYGRGEDDEFIRPACILSDGGKPVRMQDGDAVVFMNFRADRARELTRAITQTEFDGFARPRLLCLSSFVMLTEFAHDITADCAFPHLPLTNSLGEYLSKQGLTQLRIAETEKYAHVTFFFSGGQEQPFIGENRILIPSPNVATYDLKPEMSAYEVCENLVKAIKNREYDAIICNFANGDMVGHTGVLAAAIKAVEVLDECLGMITEAILEVDGNCLITADHGNVEQMKDEKTGQALTSHTNGPVPLVYVGRQQLSLKEDGSLCDISPSLLELMQLAIPPEMSGQSLIDHS
jgi:2,3-bisphosphoglycerate-independent phosphoglycerate mutase